MTMEPQTTPAPSNGGTATRLHDNTEEAAARMSSLKRSAREQLEPAVKKLAASMARHPGATVAVGLGVGYLLARLRSRR